MICDSNHRDRSSCCWDRDSSSMPVQWHGYHRTRKQAAPRRAMTSASRDASNPAVSDQAAEQGTPAMPAVAAAPAAPDARRNPREVLIALPGIKDTTIPSEVSLNRLEQFLRDNQPCDSQPVNWNKSLCQIL